MHLYMDQNLTFFEPIYAYLNVFLFRNRAPFQVLFIIISIIEFYFLTKAASMLKIEYTWMIFFFFILRYFEFFVNGLRQAIAISIIMCSVIIFFNKRYLLFLCSVLLAFGFHKSSVIILLFCPIAKKLHISQKKYGTIIYYIPLFFVLVFYNRIWDIIQGFILKIAVLLPSSLQIIILAFSTWKIELGSGLGVKLQILAYIMFLPNLLFYAKKDKLTQYLFYIFYFGIIGKYFSGQNMNLSRIFFYMEYCGIFLLAKVMPFILHDNYLKVRNTSFWFGIVIFSFLFLYNASKGVNTVGPTPYIWDLDFSFKNYFSVGI